MNRMMKKLSALFLAAATVWGAFLLSPKADAAETLYDEDFDTVCKVGEANKCYSAQGMAVGDDYLYFVQIGDDDARAVVHRIDIETGDRDLMYHSETGLDYFTNFSHSNDLDWMVVDGVEYLCVLASPKLLLFQIDDTDLIPYAEYDLKYNGGSFGPGGMAVESVSGNRVSYLFKWDRTISYAKMPITKKEGSINVVIKCTLDVSKVTVDGKVQNFTDFVNQGMGYSDGYIFMPITGNDDDATVNHSLILAYDISNVKNGSTVQPDEEKSFYVISEEYPALFEIEDCGISDDGKMYFNTNSRRTNRDTKHDGAFVLNDFVHKAKPTYTVNYNAGGGTGSMKSATVETATPLTPAKNTFKRDGYTFAGWQAYSALKKQNVQIGDTVAEGDTITLTAQWVKNSPTTYTVKYNAGGGTGDMPAVSVSVKEALKPAENAFTREGYTFTGWVVTSALSGGEVKIGDTVTGGDIITFTARWVKTSPTSYTVVYDGNGGSGTMKEQTVPATTPFSPAKNRFKREGYAFLGWTAVSTLTGEEIAEGDTVAAGDTVTLTARWAMCGDMNGDGKLSIADAFAIRLYDWGYYPLHADRAFLMDVNGDGAVNTADAHFLFAHLAGAVPLPNRE